MRACFVFMLLAGCSAIPSQQTEPRQTYSQSVPAAADQQEPAMTTDVAPGATAASACGEERGVDSGRHFESAAHIGLGTTHGCFIRDRYDGFAIEAPQGAQRLQIQIQAMDSGIAATIVRAESFRRLGRQKLDPSEHWTLEVDVGSGEELFVKLVARGGVPERARYAVVVKQMPL